MTSQLSKCAALLCLLLSGGNALADHNLWMGVKAGSLGIGVEGAWRPIPWLDLRVGANRFTLDDRGSISGVNYDAEFALDNFYGTANFRFPLSPMRLSIGAYSNGNEIELVSRDAASFNIGGTTYPGDAVGTLRSTTTFDSMSPYVGVGFDFELFDKVGLNLDLGVLWQGDPEVVLESDGILANDPLFLDALDAEREQLESEFEDFKAWPAISLGFNYQFM